MPNKAKSHEDCLKLVCAVCPNMRGKKASCEVCEADETRIRQFVFGEYSLSSNHFPKGLCNTCHGQLWKMEIDVAKHEGRQERRNIEQEQKGDNWSKDEEEDSDDNRIGNDIELLLPDNYVCEIPPLTRNNSQKICHCRWCKLARLNGPSFNMWQKKMREEREGKPEIIHICIECGKGVPVNQKVHTCKASDQDVIKNILSGIPNRLKDKLAHTLVKELKDKKKQEFGPHLPTYEAQTISLPSASGGKCLNVHLGPQPSTSKVETITHKDFIQINT